MNTKTNYNVKSNFALICLITIFFTIRGWSQNTIEVSLNYSNNTTLQKKVYGYNDEHMNKPYYSTNSTFKKVYNDLGKPTVRYPAGTGSNYLNLKTGFANDYVTGTMTPADFQRHVTDSNEGLRRNGKGENGQDWREFAKFIASEKPEVTYIINLSTMTLEENREVLEGIKDMGAKINHFEIGNEVFFSAYKTPFPNSQFYLRKAKEASEMIKTIFPNAKVAVVLPAKFYTEESFLDGPAPSGNRLENWYQDVMKEGWYDALAVHLYAENGMNSNISINNFFPYEKSYTYGISHNDNRLQSTFDRLKSDFPTKKIWLTEYHTGGFRGNLRKYKLRLSYLGGLFNANFMMKLFSNPQIELSSWHSFQQWLDFRSRGYELVPNDFEYQELINYSFFKMFKDPVKKSTKFIKTNINNSKKYDGLGEFEGKYNEVDAGTFYNPETKEGYTFIFNKKGNNYKLNKTSFENNIDGEIIEFKEITPDKSQNLITAINDTSENARLKKDISNINPQGEIYSLRPYSMYVVHYKRKETITNTPPSLSFLTPVNNITLNTRSTVSVHTEASDDDGIANVTLYVNDVFLRKDVAAPYIWGGPNGNEILKNLETGTYVLKAIAEDNLGATTTKSVTIYVKDETIDNNLPPELIVLHPTETSVFSEGNTISVRAEANDPDGSIKEVRLYLNNELIRIDTESPYVWGGNAKLQNISVGTYRLRIVAIDNEGARTRKVIVLKVKPSEFRGSRLENNEDQRIIVSPNPTNGSIISISQRGNQYLTLYNLLGKKVMDLNVKSANYTIDISGLSSGLYILKSDKAISKFIVR
ncbi:Por secretion system C-terminal sorting domain-containing protein [Aquimarina amphilecti]|uniref:Por secretion system C-terminal sorting domain-containing protein n=1 Tax=Aquimarina amphilecti TaxID=1038014 RepID=A0A1H7VZ21_AQUAM|nr:Ig-like domain-containing protein [Aquimarina amphilecti]SEM14038.1 Por secretion system C-terminal sorting domain-containing protein [Aquimarina amphilecti]